MNEPTMSSDLKRGLGIIILGLLFGHAMKEHEQHHAEPVKPPVDYSQIGKLS